MPGYTQENRFKVIGRLVSVGEEKTIERENGASFKVVDFTIQTTVSEKEKDHDAVTTTVDLPFAVFGKNAEKIIEYRDYIADSPGVIIELGGPITLRVRKSKDGASVFQSALPHIAIFKRLEGDAIPEFFRSAPPTIPDNMLDF